jgi:hypothetical protein
MSWSIEDMHRCIASLRLAAAVALELLIEKKERRSVPLVGQDRQRVKRNAFLGERLGFIG